jgi:hypothetical protein
LTYSISSFSSKPLDTPLRHAARVEHRQQHGAVLRASALAHEARRQEAVGVLLVQTAVDLDRPVEHEEFLVRSEVLGGTA